MQTNVRFKIAWALLALNGVAVLVFGVVAIALPGGSEALYLRAIGAASIGMGLFGLLIAAVPFRRLERWAWWTLWYYPAFWLAHLLAGLPPGQDHIHQVLGILFSVAGLLLPVGEFFPHGRDRKARLV